MIGRSTTVQMTDRVRQASDILEVVSAYVTLKRAGRSFKGLCPFHAEKTPSFNVTPDKQTFKCFGCGVGGDVFKFIQLREGVGFPEARAILAARAGIPLEEKSNAGASANEPGKLDIEKLNRWAARWFARQLNSADGRSAMSYLTERGFTAQSVATFQIGYAPDRWDALLAEARRERIPERLLIAAGLIKPRDDGGCYDAFRNRIIFPIRDGMDRVLGFGGRTLGDDPAKYINSPQSVLFDKSRCLFGLATAKESFRETRSAILVEGYVDCILAQQFGFTNALATLGTALTVEHVRLLSRYVDSVTIVFDSDDAGRKAADGSLPLFLTERLEVRLAHVPEGKDPADFLILRGAEAFRGILTSAVGALEFKWNQVLRQCRGQTSNLDRRRAVEEFLGLLVRSADLGSFDPIQRGFILNQVGKLLGISTEEVNRQLRMIARRSLPAQPARSASSGSGSVAMQTAVRALRDEYSAAISDLLGVLLNEPDYYEEVAAEFDPALLPDTPIGRIAREFAAMMQSGEAYSLAGLIGRFESVEMAALIVNLQSNGEVRGNYEATLHGAAQRLEQIRTQRRLTTLAAGLRGRPIGALAGIDTAGASSGAAGLQSEELSALETARQVSHFAAPKHLAAPITAGAGPIAPPAG